jgi:hypothetical protein
LGAAGFGQIGQWEGGIKRGQHMFAMSRCQFCTLSTVLVWFRFLVFGFWFLAFAFAFAFAFSFAFLSFSLLFFFHAFSVCFLISLTYDDGMTG